GCARRAAGDMARARARWHRGARLHGQLRSAEAGDCRVARRRRLSPDADRGWIDALLRDREKAAQPTLIHSWPGALAGVRTISATRATRLAVGKSTEAPPVPAEGIMRTVEKSGLPREPFLRTCFCAAEGSWGTAHVRHQYRLRIPETRRSLLGNCESVGPCAAPEDDTRYGRGVAEIGGGSGKESVSSLPKRPAPRVHTCRRLRAVRQRAVGVGQPTQHRSSRQCRLRFLSRSSPDLPRVRH